MHTLILTPQELKALAGLLDAGVKAIGLRAVRDAATLLDKIEAAAEPATTETEEADNG